MSEPLSYLPVWKANATPGDRFRELALMADKHPEWFDKFAVAYSQNLPNNRMSTSWHCYNCKTTEAIGIFEIAKIKLYEATHT